MNQSPVFSASTLSNEITNYSTYQQNEKTPSPSASNPLVAADDHRRRRLLLDPHLDRFFHLFLPSRHLCRHVPRAHADADDLADASDHDDDLADTSDHDDDLADASGAPRCLNDALLFLHAHHPVEMLAQMAAARGQVPRVDRRVDWQPVPVPVVVALAPKEERILPRTHCPNHPISLRTFWIYVLYLYDMFVLLNNKIVQSLATSQCFQ
jgi:hypothetical protein